MYYTRCTSFLETDQSQHSILLCTEEYERQLGIKLKKTKPTNKSLESPVNDHFIYSFNYDIAMISLDERGKLAHFIQTQQNQKERKTWSNLYVEGSLCILEKELSHHLFIHFRINKASLQGTSPCPLFLNKSLYHYNFLKELFIKDPLWIFIWGHMPKEIIT